jgi:hypothetical protein
MTVKRHRILQYTIVQYVISRLQIKKAFQLCNGNDSQLKEILIRFVSVYKSVGSNRTFFDVDIPIKIPKFHLTDPSSFRYSKSKCLPHVRD